MQKLRFSSVFWDFGGVITSSPFEAFSKFEIDKGTENIYQVGKRKFLKIKI